MTEQSISTVIDARTFASCQERQSAIFGTFGTLSVGQALDLIVEHDPRGIYVKLQEQYAGHFVWEYLEAGPVLWRVRISRV